MKHKDIYSEPKTYEYPGVIVKVFSPVLSDAERQTRMERIAKSAERLLTTERK